MNISNIPIGAMLRVHNETTGETYINERMTQNHIHIDCQPGQINIRCRKAKRIYPIEVIGPHDQDVILEPCVDMVAENKTYPYGVVRQWVDAGKPTQCYYDPDVGCILQRPKL